MVGSRRFCWWRVPSAPLLLGVLTALTLSAALTQPEYQAAPALAERVQAGDLPPVAERLPENPVVVEPHERVGEYGGTWHMGLVGGSDGALLTRTIGYENLMRWDPAWKEVIPNVAERVEVSDDSTTYTFYLREGMKWSDGESFTADDIMFWYEDVLLNEALTSAPSSVYTVEDEIVTVEKVDDHTVRFTFAALDGLFLQNLASTASSVTSITSYPHHYAEGFHETYNPSAAVPFKGTAGGHGGDDARLLDDLLRGAGHDPLGRAAGYVDGAKSILTGIAANRSFATGLPVQVGELLDLEALGASPSAAQEARRTHELSR